MASHFVLLFCFLLLHVILLQSRMSAELKGLFELRLILYRRELFTYFTFGLEVEGFFVIKKQTSKLSQYKKK